MNADCGDRESCLLYVNSTFWHHETCHNDEITKIKGSSLLSIWRDLRGHWALGSEGKPLEIVEEMEQRPEKEEEEALGPSSKKREREEYDANSKDIEAWSCYHIKKRKNCVIQLEIKEEADIRKDDVEKYPDYYPKEEEKKEESVDFNPRPQKEEDPFVDERYQFWRLNLE